MDIITITKYWSLIMMLMAIIIYTLLTVFVNTTSGFIFFVCMGICWYIGDIFIDKELNKIWPVDSEIANTETTIQIWFNKNSIGFWFFILPSQILSAIFIHPINPLIHWILAIIFYIIGYYIIDKRFNKQIRENTPKTNDPEIK